MAKGEPPKWQQKLRALLENDDDLDRLCWQRQDRIIKRVIEFIENEKEKGEL